jgi:hypothetical protein
MKRFKLLAITGAALVILAVLAGCASMTVVGIDNESVTGPKQVRQYRDIDPKDITVYAFYKDGSRKLLPLNKGDITFDNSKAGTQAVTIRRSGQTASFQTEVMPLSRITIASQPQTLKLGIADSKWPGLEIQAAWDQMGSEKINITECQITGIDINKAGAQTATVIWKEKQATFNVQVVAMASMRITSNPTKLTYPQGDPLSLAGIKAIGVWPGLPEEEISIAVADISGYNAEKRGKQTLTITKNGKTATFTVEVVARPVDSGLIGTWISTEDRTAYRFNSDNTVEYIGSQGVIMKLGCSSRGNNLIFIMTGNDGKETEAAYTFSISGDTLTISNPQVPTLTFFKDTSNAPPKFLGLYGTWLDSEGKELTFNNDSSFEGSLPGLVEPEQTGSVKWNPTLTYDNRVANTITATVRVGPTADSPTNTATYKYTIRSGNTLTLSDSKGTAYTYTRK